MKVRVLHQFHDRADYRKVHLVGETLVVEDARAEYLIGLGLAEELVDEPAKEIADVAKVKPVARRKKGN